MLVFHSFCIMLSVHFIDTLYFQTYYLSNKNEMLQKNVWMSVNKATYYITDHFSEKNAEWSLLGFIWKKARRTVAVSQRCSVKFTKKFPYKTAQIVLLMFFVLPITDFAKFVNVIVLILFIVFCFPVEMFEVIIFLGI